MEEDMEKICKYLTRALQETRDAWDLEALQYDEKTEIVTAKFTGGKKKINVAMDSGVAMMRDILKHI